MNCDTEIIIAPTRNNLLIALAVDDLEKLKQEFLKLTPRERAAIARAMLEGAVRYARRKKKAAM